MDMIRALHRVAGRATRSYELLSEYSALAAVGGASIASYRSSDGSDVLCELWPTEVEFAQFWQEQDRSDSPAVALAADALTEIYRHVPFGRPEWVWAPRGDEPSGPGVMWPNRRPVRIVYQFDDSAFPAIEDRPITRQTRLEPGCEEYEYLEGAGSRHLLVEKWSNQTLYDRHWDLRVRTGTAGLGTGEEVSTPADDQIEFYPFETYQLLYGSWFPTDPSAASTSVRWSTMRRK